jgi:NAD(P)-dependent dehydrogenase (short-subunit alcohol dehydrogenase family)
LSPNFLVFPNNKKKREAFMYFKNEVAIVTGGGNGIGEAAAVIFAREGAAVTVADLDGDAAQSVADKVRKSGGRAIAFQGDLTKPETSEAMVAATLKEFNRLDCAFNNVGGALPGAETPMHEIDLELFEADFALNFYANFYSLRAEVKHMLKQKKGSIVNTSSLAGLGGSLSNMSYHAGKHGIVGMTKNAAIAYGPSGIRVNAVCPGSIETPGLLKNFSGREGWREMLSHAALERIAQPSEVAELAVWLCSDRASFITGMAIPVDGGTSAFAVRVGAMRVKN